ncbi:uncharacterized protein [Asterias amurensis]|uniref:uncharacterized protein n=1 Tax=Asterias amurensis TaxID=7602 RepID=UPI003AB3C286
MVDNPPSDQPLVTLSVQVTDGGNLSISEDVNHRPPSAPKKPRVSQASGGQSPRSSKQYKRAASSRNRARALSRRIKPKNDPQTISSSGPEKNYRTVHFTLGSTRVLKESWFMDGSTQVELKPLGLLDEHVPPVYGCIDSRGELRLSMGNYNQNSLGRMASMVAAMGLEEKNPETVGDKQQPKRVVLMGGKTWPTFPVAVTIVADDEPPPQSAADPSKGVPSAAASTPGVGDPERYSRVQQTHNPRPNVQQTHNPRPKVQQTPNPRPTGQMLQANPNPVAPPMAHTTGVYLTPGPCGVRTQHQYVELRSAIYPVPPNKAVALVAENENNSSSNVTPDIQQAESVKLPRADTEDTRYTSTESLCSIDLPEGRLYIAEQTGGDSSPQIGSFPGRLLADKNYPPPKQIQEIQMGQDQNQPVSANIQQAAEIEPKTGHDAHQNQHVLNLQAGEETAAKTGREANQNQPVLNIQNAAENAAKTRHNTHQNQPALNVQQAAEIAAETRLNTHQNQPALNIQQAAEIAAETGHNHQNLPAPNIQQAAEIAAESGHNVHQNQPALNIQQAAEIAAESGHNVHQNQPALNIQQAAEITPKTAGLGTELTHRNNTTLCLAADKMDLPSETNSLEKNFDPLHTSDAPPPDFGGKATPNAASSSGPGADSMDEFLKYLQHLNTVMETVMAGGTGEPMPE